MAKGTTWYKAKLAKLQKQIREGVPQLRHGNIERDKPLNQRHETIAAAERIRRDTDPLLAAYEARGGERKTYEPGPTLKPEGKGKRKFDTTTGGNGARLRPAIQSAWADWSATMPGTLIPARR